MYVFIVKALLALIALFPLRLLAGFLALVMRYVSGLFRRERSIAKVQMETALRLTPQQSQKLCSASFAHLGRCVAEMLKIEHLLKRRPSLPDRPTPRTPLYQYIKGDGSDGMEAHTDSGKATIALSAHLGCFELLAAYHADCGYDISVIGRGVRNTGFGPFVENMRKNYGVQTILRDAADVGSKIRRAIRSKHLIAVMIDQDTEVENLFNPFFGLPAAHPIGLLRLAIRHELGILTTFIVREANNTHRVISEQIKYDPKDPAAAEFIVRTYSARVEALIRQYPDQWMWWHRRWRREPGVDYDQQPERLRSSVEYIAWLEEQKTARATGATAELFIEKGI